MGNCIPKDSNNKNNHVVLENEDPENDWFLIESRADRVKK